MSRDKILEMIRRNAPTTEVSSFLPEKRKQLSADLLKDLFTENLLKVGASFAEVNGNEEISGFLKKEFPEISDFRDQNNWEEYRSASPEKLDQLNGVLLKGQFGVAENGAVWLDESGFPNRLIPFIARKVILILDSKQLVEDMHQAYQRIQNSQSGFGVFISGPSKTADIEQSLVYGAHGPVSLMVLLC